MMKSAAVTLPALVERLEQAGSIVAARRANVRASVRRYAAALGCVDANQCGEAQFVLEKNERNSIIERAFDQQQASPHLIRNTKNDISFVLREAERLGLIDTSLPAPDQATGLQSGEMVRRKLEHKLPARIAPKDTGFHREHYSLPEKEWGAVLRDQYEAWKEWTLHTKIRAPEINPRNTAATVEDKTTRLEAFFGYLFNVRKITEPNFEMLLDVDFGSDEQSFAFDSFVAVRRQPTVGLLEEFVEWHRVRHNGRASFQTRNLVSLAANVAQKYFYLQAVSQNDYKKAEKYRRLTEQLNRLRARLTAELSKNEKPIAEKPLALALTAAQLLDAARREFPHARRLYDEQAGNLLALNAGRALALMFLVKHPLRNKRYREARLSENILQNEDGEWTLRFGNSQAARTNSKFSNLGYYETKLDRELSDYLRMYLEMWRPKLLEQTQIQRDKTIKIPSNDAGGEAATEAANFVFLNSVGRPFIRQEFSSWIEKGVFRWTGIRVNSEAIRRIAAFSRSTNF